MTTLKIKTHRPPSVEELRGKFETVDLMQKDAPDVRFTGKLIGEIDSRTVDTRGRRDAERYTKLELYELESGRWVAAAVACSDRSGEVDIATVTVLGTDGVFSVDYTGISEGVKHGRIMPPEEARQRAVLQAFGWTWLAKAFADRMGWDHVQVIS